MIINITPPYILNPIHRGLSCQNYKKQFYHHKILVNVQTHPTVMGRGAEAMYNQITFIFSKE